MARTTIRKGATKGKAASSRKKAPAKKSLRAKAARKPAAPAKPTTEWLDLGDGLKAYYARPAGRGPFPAILVYIEAFGVNTHFKKMAARFAREGFCTIVPDLYDGLIVDYSNIDAAIAKLRSLNDDQVMARSLRCVEALSARREVRKGKVGVTGFCMGGRYTVLANAVLADRIGAAVSFYGGGIAPIQDRAGRKPLLEFIPSMKAPVHFYYGTKDTSILPDEIGRIAEAMALANKRFTMTVFDDVGHGFFCEDRPSYAKAAAQQSWKEMIALFRNAL